MAKEQTNSELPEWIPDSVRSAYLSPANQRRYSDDRMKSAWESLFHSPSLEAFWRHVAKAKLSPAQSDLFARRVLYNLRFAPLEGRSTRDRPDRKTLLRDVQNKADKIRKSAAVTAKLLAQQFRAFEKTNRVGGYAALSSANLLHLSMRKRDQDFLRKRFENFINSVPIHDPRNIFPSTGTFLETLAGALDVSLDADTVFSKDPRLSSRQSSYRDFVKGLGSDLKNFRAFDGIDLTLRPKDWICLVKTFFRIDVDHRHLKGTLD